MLAIRIKNLLLIPVVLLAMGVAGIASAHLMVAQRGTLNFTDKGVYLVLSLPASAFIEADDNRDQKLQTAEFIEHRLDIIAKITNDVLMYRDNTAYSVEGMMLTPVQEGSMQQEGGNHQHHAEKTTVSSGSARSSDIEQIIVMGRFPVVYAKDEKHHFQTTLLGETKAEQKLTLVAKRADKAIQHEFEIVPGTNKIWLFPLIPELPQ